METHQDNLSDPLKEKAQRLETERQENEQIMEKIEAEHGRKRGWFYRLLCWLVEPETGWPGRRE
jgi:hypothetical protein